MQSLQKRCGELGLHPCREAGMTKEILLRKINDEERRLGLALTTVNVVTATTAKKPTNGIVVTKTKKLTNSVVATSSASTAEAKELTRATKTVEKKAAVIKRQNRAATQEEPVKSQDGVMKKEEGGNPVKSQDGVMKKEEGGIPIKSSPKVNQYEEEIKEMNPELYNAVKPFFDIGKVPAGHNWGGDAVEGEERWNQNVGSLLRDPWHSLHAQLALLGFESEEREKDRARIAHYSGEKVKTKEWDFKTFEELRTFVNRYDLILWGIWLANKRRSTLLTLFTEADRLDLYIPIKKVTRQMLDGIRSSETAKALYEADPLSKVIIGSRIADIYWKIASGQMTPQLALEFAEKARFSYEGDRDAVWKLLELGYLHPTPKVLIKSLGDEDLFQQIVAMPTVALSKNDGELLATLLKKYWWYFDEILNKSPDIMPETIEKRIKQIIDTFSIDIAQITTKSLTRLSHNNLLPAFLDSKSVQDRLSDIIVQGITDNSGPGLYTIKRIFEEGYDTLVAPDVWKRLLVAALAFWGFDRQVEFISKKYPLSYDELVDGLEQSEDIYYRSVSEIRTYLTSIIPPAEYDNRVLHLFLKVYNQPGYAKRYGGFLQAIIRLGIYKLDKKSISELVAALPKKSALLLLSQPKVKKLLDDRTMKQLRKQIDAKKDE